MTLAILCTDPDHPVVERLREWAAHMMSEGHTVSIHRDKSELPGGDILFLVSCSQLIGDAERKKYKAALVLHASDLPRGRGWSPHVWAILGGAKHIVVCLLEASDPVDSGDVWLRSRFELEGHELLSEINEKLFTTEIDMMTKAVDNFEAISPVAQEGEPGPYLRRRTPEDSRLDPDRTLAEQFDLLRVADPQRYPAFFEHRGKRFIISIAKSDDE